MVMSSEGRKPTAADWRRFGDEVLKRRDRELHLTQTEVADRGGPSTTTLTNIEHGKAAAISKGTLKNLDKALEWEEGSAWGVLYEALPPTPKNQFRPRPVPERPDVSESALRRLLEIRRELDLVIDDIRNGQRV